MTKIRSFPPVVLMTVWVLIGSIIWPGACRNSGRISPNVVVIVIDTLRADHLSSYGYPLETAPWIASRAREGVVFERAFSTSSLTAPATASLFTSYYPFQHGVVMNIGGTVQLRKKQPRLKVRLNKIPEEIVTLGETFKEAGYATYGVADNINIGDKEAFDQGFDRFFTTTYKGAPVINQTVRKLKPEITGSRPYFLYLHYMDPHQPLYARAPYFEKHARSENDKIAMYDSEIHFSDRHIAELSDLLGWDSDTLIVITSDHGEGLGEHGTFGHGVNLYREAIHVPLIFCFPEKLSAGRVSANVSLIDVLPTLRAILGLPADPNHEGVNLQPLMTEHSAAARKSAADRFLFAHLWDWTFSKPHDAVEAVIYQDWHFIKNFAAEKELYHLRFDPGEKFNQGESNLGIARRLYGKYRAFKDSCRTFNRDSTVYALSPEEVEKLKTLGYINTR